MTTRTRQTRTSTTSRFSHTTLLTLVAGAAMAATVFAHDPAATDPTAPSADVPYAVINGERVDVPDIAMGDAATIAKILEEGKNNNQVMDQLNHLCTNIGPRLTGSSNVELANNWARDQFASWGMENTELFEWGKIPVRFDRGPSTAKVVVRRERGDTVTYSDGMELAFTTLAWAPGTDGVVQAHVVRLPKTLEELAAIEADIEGAWVVLPSNASGRRGVRGPAASASARLGYWKELREELEDEPETESMNNEAQNDTQNEAQNEAQREAQNTTHSIASTETSAGYSGDEYSGAWTGTTTGPNLPDQGAKFVLVLKSIENTAVKGMLSYPGIEYSAPLTDATLNKDTGQLKFGWVTPTGEHVTQTWSLINGIISARKAAGGGEFYVNVGKRSVQRAAEEQRPARSRTRAGGSSRFEGEHPKEGTAGDPQDPYTGTWEGLTRGGMAGNEGMPFTLKLKVDSDGTATGRIDYIGFGSKFADGKVDLDTGTFQCKWESPMGPVKWGAILGKDGTLSGSFPDPTGSGDKITQSGGRTSGGKAKTPRSKIPVVADKGAPASADNANANTMDPQELEREIMKRVLARSPAGWVSSSGDDRVWTSSVRGWRGLDFDDLHKDCEIIVNESGFDYINSKLTDNWPIELVVDADNRLIEGPFGVYNTIGEIRGTQWPDEVVVVSAHLDSWNGPGSRGTVDNGTGSSVTIEAARILTAVGAQPKRTIRFILWTGEEQGLLGSRGYVESLSEDERKKIVACLVDDGGTNYEGGILCIESMSQYLAAATAPTNGQFYSPVDYERKMNDDNPDNDERAGWLDVNVHTAERMPRGGASDHASFNRVGIPGFFWDEVGRANYRHGWHTQYDRLDQAIEEYLIQSSTNAAITAYNLACAPEMLPREIPSEEAGQ